MSAQSFCRSWAKNKSLLRPALLLLLFSILTSGCSIFSGSTKPQSYNGGQGGSAPRGTKPYTINGKTYYPLISAVGFSERGIASWYGPDFHGKQTANGERYDMHGMTAAHKLLPFNSKVRVTNQTNGKYIIVRINDRGPFVDGRIIDLTKEGARRIGMLGSGTAPVLIEVIEDPGLGGYTATTSSSSSSTQGTKPVATSSAQTYSKYYIQVGAFGAKANAENLASRLRAKGHNTRVVPGENNLWRVQVGPYNNMSTADTIAVDLSGEFPNNFTVPE